MIVVKVYFKDSILDVMQPEDVAHPFLLIGGRVKFKDYLIKGEAKWEQ